MPSQLSYICLQVNYSISLGLGFAGTVKTYTHHSGTSPDEVLLNSYRSATYMGIGLAGSGVFLAIVFVLKSYWQDRIKNQKEDGKQSDSLEN